MYLFVKIASENTERGGGVGEGDTVHPADPTIAEIATASKSLAHSTLILATRSESLLRRKNNDRSPGRRVAAPADRKERDRTKEARQV